MKLRSINFLHFWFLAAFRFCLIAEKRGHEGGQKEEAHMPCKIAHSSVTSSAMGFIFLHQEAQMAYLAHAQVRKDPKVSIAVKC